MTTIFAPTALLPDGWAQNVLIECDKDGWITGIDTFKAALPADGAAEVVAGPLVPGMPNVHSHAFQRAIAGLTERANIKKDTFWNWRETVYRFLSRIDPDDMHVLATQVYIDMLKAGYTAVGEFHYVHHQQDGTPYADRPLMSRQIVQAAIETGIAITHMPVLYAHSGFGAQAPKEGQKRFLNDVSGLMRIIGELYGEYRSQPQVTVGYAHHSLRAVSPEMLAEGTAAIRKLSPEAPIHIHAAEQMAEVEACLEWSGKRPVEWLLENAGIDDRWCLVHCTHMTAAELRAMAESRAVVGLCPTTEANLGDGIFPLAEYFRAGGAFGIGSDSHISLNMAEELRWLEYVQRLVLRERTIVRDHELPSVGATLFERALSGGARAMGRKCGRIDIGYRADFLVLDADLPIMSGKLRDHILDTAIFAANKSPVRDVMAGGKWVIRDRHHRREEKAAEDFRRVLEKLK
jgi:formimidoylglutamate deiminase